MAEYLTLEQIDEAAEAVRKSTTYQPRIGMILGSGLGSLANQIQDAQTIPYEKIPHWPPSTVQGHKGNLVLGNLDGQPVMTLQGRTHFYEGFSMAEITMPVRVMKRLGVEILVVTNAAGAINPDFEPGDVMLITDHIGLIGMTGNNPLRGANIDEFGPRFPDMSRAYDPELMKNARAAAKNAGVSMHEGVYIGLSGPSFETPADLRFLRAIGADAVGMSTVPEVTVACHCGMRVLGFSGISNKANLDGSTVTTHEEVLQAGDVIVPKISSILHNFLTSLK
jgi:purine-nucleoside phosphorylase